ncbi:MAG TPA: SGNH/GDSL hydrolase family protein [Gemmatimonadaceae bacterium]|nr:SGNH/GDSL hydrolase family protein [Gemmatimonadaceae bacterium]
MTRALRYLALGDSYTIGEGATESDRWPVQLVRALRERGVQLADAEIIAKTGWTAGELNDAISQANPSGPYALVTLLAGVNNQYRGMIQASFRVQFKSVLQRAIELAGDLSHHVIVVSIPDWGVTPWNATRKTPRSPSRVAREIDAYNRIVQKLASAAHAHFIDITDLTRAEPHAVVADGLHPSGQMYARWVERVLPVAQRLLDS